ncbi:MAG: sugar ABC transporter permease [Armatimonadota bacterium]
MLKTTSWKVPYSFILPAMTVVVFCSMLPNLYSFYLAFTNYSLYHYTKYDFVGIQNFITIFTQKEINTFIRVFGWTFVWAIVSVAGMLTIGLALAIMLNTKGFKLKNFYRTLLVVPWAIPAFISVLMWQGLLWPDSGVLNTLLGTKVNWLGDPNLARFSVLMVNIWLGFPFFMTLCLGALQSIPTDLYEAAGVDGASKFSQFFKITVPILSTTLLPASVMSFAFNFNQFLSIYLLTAGLPPVSGSRAGATDILVTYSYKLAFTLFKYGLACAYAVIIFIVIALICGINFKATGTFKEAK